MTVHRLLSIASPDRVKKHGYNLPRRAHIEPLVAWSESNSLTVNQFAPDLNHRSNRLSRAERSQLFACACSESHTEV
jgi:hypothetical protein